MSEKEFIAQLTEGSQSAFRELVDSYKDRVFNTSLGLLRNTEEAEDISQEVFIEVFNSVKAFRGDSTLATWIYRITVTKSLDFIRKKKRKKRFAFFTSLFTEKGEYIKEPVDFFHPGVESENAELSAVLFKAIEKLPQNQKIAFSLNKLEDLSYKEISQIMGLSISSVESLLFRARSNLKNILNNYYSSV